MTDYNKTDALLDLVERLRHVPIMNDVDGLDVELCEDIAKTMSVRENNAPTEPGWYWCYQASDDALFISRVDRYDGTLFAAWFTSPGNSKCISERRWDASCRWSDKLITAVVK